uniref:Macaca fascicularis brain cDNA, clone: QflA-18496 n=1 Tax=Macaca fascicularis TaxID=9541 RepID=I7GLJ5_MACFA|nr:unnamed protein product [Macaca fascicularis]
MEQIRTPMLISSGTMAVNSQKIHTRTCAHTHTQTHTHAHMRTHVHTRAHTHTCAYTCIYTYLHMRICL